MDLVSQAMEPYKSKWKELIYKPYWNTRVIFMNDPSIFRFLISKVAFKKVDKGGTPKNLELI